MKRISDSVLFHVISSIFGAPSISVKARPVIFVRLTEYLKFSSRNLLRRNNKSFVRKFFFFCENLSTKKKTKDF
jgi:hypothetical protein